MKTVVLGPRPEELEALIQRRKQQGLDRFDEVWEGVYHLAPAAHPAHGYVDHALAVLLHPYASRAGLVGTGPFNLGTSEDYRVPDHGYHRSLPRDIWVSTAAVVVEVLSPDDETYDKLTFYARHDVTEIIIADPRERSIRCLRLRGGDYDEAARSELLGVDAQELTSAIDWPDI